MMTRPFRSSVLFVCLVLSTTVTSSASWAVEAIRGVRVQRVGEGATGGVPFLPGGENQPTQADGSEVCCELSDSCLPIGGPYDVGESVTFNTYWTDVMPDPIPDDSWIVDWSLSLMLEDGTSIELFEPVPVDFGNLFGLFEPGEEVRFCVAGISEIRNAWCPGLVTQQHGVVSITGELPFGDSEPDTDDDDLTCEGGCKSRLAVLPKLGEPPVVGLYLRHGISTSITTTIDYAIYDFAGHLMGGWVDGPETFELGDDYRFVGPLPGVGRLEPGRYRMEATIDA